MASGWGKHQSSCGDLGIRTASRKLSKKWFIKMTYYLPRKMWRSLRIDQHVVGISQCHYRGWREDPVSGHIRIYHLSFLKKGRCHEKIRPCNTGNICRCRSMWEPRNLRLCHPDTLVSSKKTTARYVRWSKWQQITPTVPVRTWLSVERLKLTRSLFCQAQGVFFKSA